jgi:hypothetical protein
MKKIFYGMCGTAAVALAVLVCGACKGSYLDPSIADYNSGGGSGGGGGGGAGESGLYFMGALYRMSGDEDAEETGHCYWHNGTETPLTGALGLNVYNEVLYRGKLYQCGRYEDAPSNPGYWINGSRRELEKFTESNWESAYDITVVNGNTHITGNADGRNILCYWVNGEKKTLTLNIPDSEDKALSGIATDGEKVYIMGWYTTQDMSRSTNYTYTAFYFSPADGGEVKEFFSTTIPNPSTKSIYLYKIYVVHGDVYIIVEEEDSGYYYYVNGGNKTRFSVPSDWFEDVIVLNNTVYAVGVTYDPTNLSTARACYWKNGVQKQLSDKMSAASSIGIWNN